MKQSIFIAYKHSGRNFEEFKPTLFEVTNILRKKGYKVYIYFEEEDKPELKELEIEQIYEYTMNKLLDYDIFMPLIDHPAPSTGMGMEFGVARRNDKIIITCIQEDLSYEEFRNSADRVIEFVNFKDLVDKIEDEF